MINLFQVSRRQARNQNIEPRTNNSVFLVPSSGLTTNQEQQTTLTIKVTMFFKDYKTNTNTKIRESLLWEFRNEDVDFWEMKTIVVQRVIERGRINDFYAILNLYGENEVKAIIKNISYLNNKDIAFVCAVFDLKKEDLKCYIKKQLQTQRWNS